MAEVAADVLRVEICAPERESRVMEAIEIIAPGLEGQFTVLPDHTPFLSVLTAGVLTVCDADEQEHLFAVNGGFVEVNQNQVVVLAMTAEASDEVDAARAEAARDRALKRLDKPGSEIDLTRAEVALKRAIARLDAGGRAAG